MEVPECVIKAVWKNVREVHRNFFIDSIDVLYVIFKSTHDNRFFEDPWIFSSDTTILHL